MVSIIGIENMEQRTTLSQRAKAFSVEALLGHQRTDENVSGKAQNLSPKEKRKRVSSNDIKVELVNSSLWLQFHLLGNEMIITKAGRRIFPCLKFDIRNLKPNANYLIWMDIVPLDGHRYRYAFPNSRWMVAGKCESHSGNRRYVHPDGVAQGNHWMSQSVSFDKLKLTNNKECKQKGQIVLNSMHKYLPRLHIQIVDDLNRQDSIPNEKHSRHFEFPETSFIAVTAYQNQQITNLKIRSNPFAKGFRDAIKIRNINLQCLDNKNDISFPHSTVKIFHPEELFKIDSVPDEMLQCMPFPQYLTSYNFCQCHSNTLARENTINILFPHLSQTCRMHTF